MLETHDVQGMLFSGYSKQVSAMYLFFSIREPAKAKAWFAAIAPQVTAGGTFDRNRDSSLNVAITYKGFASLGLSDATLATFSRPFAEDMSEINRARLLGDSPDTWQWGKPDHRIHVLLMLFAKNQDVLAARVATERARAADALDELFAIASEDTPARPGHLASEEHFGFLDGLAQPTIAEYRPDKQAGNGPGNAVKAGEFILGYENEYGQETDSPILKAPDADPEAILAGGDLGRNGCYLVVRQLSQDVAGLWTMLQSECRRPDGSSDPAAEEALGAKLVGRWRDGTPIAVSPDHAGGDPKTHNDFGFTQDPYGYRCPFGAHMRRANPRDTLLASAADSIMTDKRHRLLRRGRPYGPPLDDRYHDDGQARGLVFLTLNANLERQFEFVQHAWITSPNFAGLYDEADPVLGGRTETPGIFTIPKDPIRVRHKTMLPHVDVKGGAYFFLPSLRALRYLGR
jgi:Dyp-type peroxidase family